MTDAMTAYLCLEEIHDAKNRLQVHASTLGLPGLRP